MNTIESKINQFIDELSKEHDLFKYIYNTKPENTDFSKSNIYYSGPYWDKKEITAIFKSVLLGKWLSSGESVHKFEHEFSKKFKTKHSLMVNSGSSANLVMIAACKKVFGWNDGDEIILSSVGFPTTLAPIIQNNLNPIFIDIEFQTLNFDVTLIEEKITHRTKAIFVSPVLGNPPDMDKIIDAKLEKRDLDALDLSDELKKEVSTYAKIQGVSVKKALSSDYISFLKDKEEKNQRIDDASLGSKRKPTKKDYSDMKPSDFNLGTPEGKADFAKYEEHLRQQLG